MKAQLQLSLVIAVLASFVSSDVYLHVPRGSNNRLNEKSANRNNANRVFDSQNNNRGGYNAGDTTDKPAGNDEGNQYRMKYFQSGPGYKTSAGGQSELSIEWTNQHGCGGSETSDPHKLNCNLVLQYMCQDDVDSPTGAQTEAVFRNGVQTQAQQHNKPNANEKQGQANQRRANNVKVDRVLHENWEDYDKCYVRERNKGLFTADQILKDNNGLGYSSAIYTRQNPNGNRRGYECPEERDYFPYWHPSAWKDIAVLTDNTTLCAAHFQGKSFNTQPYHECIEYWDAGKTKRKHYSRYNNQADCTENGGSWTLLYNFLEKDSSVSSELVCKAKSSNGVNYIWEVPYDSADGKSKECLVSLDKPDCVQAPWSRSNHLGNGREGAANNYTWTLPFFPSMKTKRCVFRMRYNISTDDYDPFRTDASHNKDRGGGRSSPVEQNPYVEVGAGSSPLRLAINTAQFGRVFQDRTHVFKLMPRETLFLNSKIYNLNVRGKRGNIVQTYPAVEYDFHPNHLHMTQGELVHIQWTGSNTHNNGDPAGDGQAGDAGEGKAGTDRSNVVQIKNLNENYPVPYENSTMWMNAEIEWIYHGKKTINKKDLALAFASAGYFQCMTNAVCGEESAETKSNMQNQLNNAPASFEGVLLKFKKGSYYYTCSRNNNFTNRSQKGAIHVR